LGASLRRREARAALIILVSVGVGLVANLAASGFALARWRWWLMGGAVAGSLLWALFEAWDVRAKEKEAQADHVDLNQLPRDVSDFTGRTEIARYLHRLLRKSRRPTPLVLAITGKPGVGKTTLAIHLAHRSRRTFAGGVLYVNLRRGTGTETYPSAVLSSFLTTLGVDPSLIPQDIEDRAALYRSRLAGSRTLVLLDNAIAESQVRPLIPATPDCSVIITSRQRLGALEDATQIHLETLPQPFAEELLAKILGVERVAAEPDEVRRLARLCGGLPLALRISGALLQSRQHWSVAHLVHQLQHEHRSLEPLSIGDLNVRAAFSLSYRGLSLAEQILFRRSVAADFSSYPWWLVESILGIERNSGQAHLEALFQANLFDVIPDEPLPEQTRYGFHDLLRRYAHELLDQDLRGASAQAFHRIASAYLAVTREVMGKFQTGTPIVTMKTALAWQPHDASAILKDIDPNVWFHIERVNLIEVIRKASELDLVPLAPELAYLLYPLFERNVNYDDWRQTHETALQSAERNGHDLAGAMLLSNLAILDQEQHRINESINKFMISIPKLRALRAHHATARALAGLGVTYRVNGQYNEALECFLEAIPISRDVGDLRFAAHGLRNIGVIYRQLGQMEEAGSNLQAARVAFERIGEEHSVAYVNWNLGILFRMQNNLEGSVAVLTSALEVMRKEGDDPSTAGALNALAETYGALGNWRAAVDCYQQSADIRFMLNDLPGRAYTLYRLSKAAKSMGNTWLAASSRRRATVLFRQIGIADPEESERWLGE
jgi:tetratricopeptide (TPR) repeat protein